MEMNLHLLVLKKVPMACRVSTQLETSHADLMQIVEFTGLMQVCHQVVTKPVCWLCQVASSL